MYSRNGKMSMPIAAENQHSSLRVESETPNWPNNLLAGAADTKHNGNMKENE